MSGHPELKAPYSTSEMRHMVHTMRAHFNAMHDQAHAAAAELRRELPRATGKKLDTFRVDRRINAYRVAKNLTHLAALCKACAITLSIMLQTYERLFTSGGTAKHRGGFDVDK